MKHTRSPYKLPAMQTPAHFSKPRTFGTRTMLMGFTPRTANSFYDQYVQKGH